MINEVFPIFLSHQEDRDRREVSGKKEFSLADILDPSRVVPEEYRRLILRQERTNDARFSDAPYSRSWLRFTEKSGLLDIFSKSETVAVSDFLKKHLSAGTLFDLGGAGGVLVPACVTWGVRNYINIDRVFDPTKPSCPTQEIPDYRDKKINSGMRVVCVNSDMLEFLSLAKTGSGNITINGIDSFIIPDDNYHEALAKEIIRVTKEGGLIFGIGSSVLLELHILSKKENSRIRYIDFPKTLTGINWGIFEKIA